MESSVSGTFAGQVFLKRSTSTAHTMLPSSSRYSPGLTGVAGSPLQYSEGEECLLDGTPQLLGHRFKVGMEFDICLLFVFLGTLAALTSRRHRNRPAALLLEFASSFYLLYATYNRTFMIRHTEISQWIRDLCANGVPSLIYDYIFLSVVSWVSSSFLEYSSSLNLGKLYCVKFKELIARFSSIRWNYGRLFVLGATAVCTINSLVLTLVLWGKVQKSLGTLAQDVSVLVFLTIAAILRLIRQLMEGATLVAGIATRELKWRNPNSKILFGRLSVSSFVLLIHSSSLTYTFAYQERKVWGWSEYTLFFALCVDVVFRLFVCGWASLNSCCVAKVVLCASKCNSVVYTVTRSFVSGVVNNVTTASQIHTCVDYAFFGDRNFLVMNVFFRGVVRLVRLLLVLRCFIYSSVWSVARFIFVVMKPVFDAVSVVLTQMCVAWRTYIEHWPDENQPLEEDFDDPFLERYIPPQVRMETNRTHGRDQLLVTPPALPPRHHRVEVLICTACVELAMRHLRQTDASGSQDGYVISFPTNLCGEEDPPIIHETADIDYSLYIVGSYCRLEVRCMEEECH